MSQADDDPTEQRRHVTLTFDEVQNLADRLLSRGLTKLSTETEHQQRDLKLASRVIRALARSFNRADVITVENGI